MESRHFFLYRQTGLALLFALLLPLVAACGGQPVAAPTAAPAAPAAPTAAPVAAATTAPAADAAPTVAPAAAPTAAPASTESDTSKFLVFGSSGEPDNLDTMETTSGVALYIGQQVVEKLIVAKPGTLDLQPGLASEWTSNADSSEWTFKLRSGVTFHDGTPFNADAVVFNFKRMAEPDFEFGFREGEGAKTYAIFPDIFGGFKGDPNSVWNDV